MYAMRISIKGRKIISHDTDLIIQWIANRTIRKHASLWRKIDKVFIVTNAL